jgi:signal transduction histidine kinase
MGGLFFVQKPAGILVATLLVMVVALHSSPVLAQPFYESSYIALQEQSGGQLHLGATVQTTAVSGAETLFMFVKQKPYGMTESDVVSSWLGPQQKNLRRATLAGGSILDAAWLTHQTMLAVVRRDSTWTLVELDMTLHLQREVVLPVRTDAAVTDGLDRVELLCVGNKRTAVVLINGCLLLCRVQAENQQGVSALPMQVKPISTAKVTDVIALDAFTRDSSDAAFAYLTDAGLRQFVALANEHGTTLSEQALNVQQQCALQHISHQAVAACVDVGGATQVHIVRASGVLTQTLPVRPEHLCVLQMQYGFEILYLSYEGGRYWVKAVRQKGSGFTAPELIVALPNNFFAPIALTRIQFVAQRQGETRLAAVFQNAVATLELQRGRLLSVNYVTGILPSGIVGTGAERRVSFVGNEADNLYVLSLERTNVMFQKRQIRLWWLRNIIADWWMYALALLASGFALWLLFIVRNQRRLLYALFQMPEADAMIILDNEGKLQTLNDAARKLLSMPPDVPMRRIFHFYCSGESARELENFAIEALADRATRSKRLSFRPLGTEPPTPSISDTSRSNGLPRSLDESDSIDILFSAIPIRTRFGAIKGLMLLGKDITEAVEKKRLSNWAQLAHDLQTNLSTIKLSAERLSAAQAVGDVAEPTSRILYQVNLVMKRVRDIIDIGRTDGLQQQQADAADICLNVRREFDDSLFPHVDFELHAEHIVFLCDAVKLERAIRNAVENGIRAMNKRGLIQIDCRLEGSDVVFEVRDSGEGMDAEVLRNITKHDAKPGFTTFRDKGGYGMGTMIMRYIMTLHGGEMRVRSQKGNGTTIEFRIPARAARKLAAKPLELVRMNNIKM